MGRKAKETVPGVRIWKRGGQGPGVRYKISYIDAQTKRQRTRSISTDYTLTVEKARQIAKSQERIRLGLAQPVEERHAEHDMKSIESHLEDWRKWMIGKARNDKHVRQFHANARDVLLGTPADAPTTGRGRKKSQKPVKLPALGIVRVSQVIDKAVEQQIARIKAERSAATANRYLDAVNRFLNWGVPALWAANPCRGIEKYNVAADRRVIRRVIEPEDFARLIETTEAGPARAKLTGLERSLIYRFAVATGLRRSEVRNVRVCDLDLKRRRVWTRASIAKNRRRQPVQILAPSLIEELRTAAEGKAPEDCLFRCPSNTARMLKLDLEAAGIPYVTADGRFDFHAVRHLCGAMLVTAGITVKAVQEHMRHSNITLTLDTYGHLLDGDHQALQKALPDFTRHRTPAVQGGVVTADQPFVFSLMMASGTRDGFTVGPVSSFMHEALRLALRADDVIDVSPVEPRGIEPRFAECDAIASPPDQPTRSPETASTSSNRPSRGSQERHKATLMDTRNRACAAPGAARRSLRRRRPFGFAGGGVSARSAW